MFVMSHFLISCVYFANKYLCFQKEFDLELFTEMFFTLSGASGRTNTQFDQTPAI